MANAVLAQYVQFLTPEPVAREQRAVIIDQEPFAAAGYCPAAADVRIQYCGDPAR
ncbi:hypothetical protein D3C85_1759470 [compost metagenome]